jgi:CHAT domain-containing protein/tetratricopeptide (TPR) repeat protein
MVMRRTVATWIISGTAFVAAFAGVLTYRAVPRDAIRRLARVKLAHRVDEARFCGGFPWARLSPGSSRDSKVALASVLADVSRKRDASSRHAIALANALSDQPRNAVAILEKLASSTPSAAIWSDLGAARYAVAVATHHPEDLVSALTAVDAALRAQNDLPEARFNRALILERLGLRDPAIMAWNRFLEHDGTSGWAIEAREHLGRLATTRPAFPQLSESDAARLAASPQQLRALTRQFPQETRVVAEREILGRWGEAMRAGNSGGAARDLSFATIVGDELLQMTGDRMLQTSVGAITAADPATRLVLAAGHADFSSALTTFRSGRSGEAEPLFERAARELDAGRSPFAFTARFFASYARYEQGEVAQSTRELEELLARVPDELLTCRATIQWQLAICYGAEARWGEDIDAAEASLANFIRARESTNAASMREHIAQAHELIGDPTTAWKYRAAALPELGRTSTRFLQAGVLGFLAQEAVFRRDWAAAASFEELELEVGRIARYAPSLADGRLRRALIRRRLGDPDPSDDIARARNIISSIPDAGMRGRLDARAVAVEAMVARTPAEAVPLLTAAIDFHGGPHGQRMFLPALLLDRARAQRALRQTGMARRDLDVAIQELDAGRETLRSPEQRAGMFESADGVLDEAIDLALEQRNVAAAFAYAEHARARALSDAMRETTAAPAVPVPPRTALIEYAILPSHAVIFVLQGSEIRVAMVEIDRATLTDRASAFTDALSHGTAAPRLGAEVARALLSPIESWIRDAETLVIVPDAATSAIPFAALPLPDGRFLVERHILVSAPSAALFAGLARARNRSGSGGLLMVVNSARDASGLEPLPGADREARSIARFYREGRVLSGAEAGRAAFLGAVARASVIHFAGHALSSEYRPEDTGILLSGAGGRMSLHDIAKLQLNGDATVVLAACSTARGRVRRYEGTLSVARAFLAAGAPSVIATLWPIDDEEAAVFFPRLHERLAGGVPAAAALRAAQLEAIRDSRPPSLWAAMQTMGK